METNCSACFNIKCPFRGQTNAATYCMNNEGNKDSEQPIEIPFGAKDSELCGFTYTIPDGMEAVIEDGKVIVRKKESDDERIRNFLISKMEEVGNVWKEYSAKDIIAWLEKQGNQEQLYIRFGEIPTDEKSKIYQGEIEVGTENGVSVYPAFKTSEGDIVLGLSLPITKTTLYTQQHLIEYDNRPCYLVKGNYVGKDTDGQYLINNVSIIEKIGCYRAKEEKQGEKPNTDFSDLRTWKYIADYVLTRWCGIGQYLDNPYLTTIAEELQKKYYLEQEQGEQKQWEPVESVSEEDKLYLMKDEHNPAEWSEEDDNCLSTIIAEFSKCAGKSVSKDEWMRCNDFLNSLKERVQPQQKQEWSAEDERIFHALTRALARISVNTRTDSTSVNYSFFTEINWLRALKDRFIWKPSEEQMHYLSWIANIKLGDSVVEQEVSKHLNELYKDLKKLI